ncbi:replicative DNA helicase [Hymenobacter fodinae]|uniref:Replicative DNA helicase n=1 Tax=Hymenobacter fodinae TaxID=2510796 RepID=A0A4Z0P8N9_9BACT|nr:replicative DNA helicase [Hymenobacter fodinae]TGE08774.1 replicative DNA helicase [Hymenobacter fodinae]
MNPLDNFSHLPQNSDELERAVLGIMLTSDAGLRDALTLLKNGEKIFYTPAHRYLFNAIQALRTEGITVDNLTVSQRLAKDGTLRSTGGAGYVNKLYTHAPRGRAIGDYCQFLLQLTAKRQIGELFQELLKGSIDPTSDVQEMMAQAYTRIHTIQQSLHTSGPITVADMLEQVATEIEQAAQKAGGITGVPCGLAAVDDVSGGWQPSDLIIIAARPGVGKTSFALAGAVPAARSGYPGAIFNLEMSNTQMVRKMIATELGEYTTSQLQKGYFPSGGLEEAKTIRHRTQGLRNAQIYINDTPGLSISEFRAHAAKLKAEHNIQWIIVDYLQLMTAPGKGTREQEIAAISRGLKLTAKELNVPVLALSQLSRAVETRGGEKKPMLSDLRESGSIEQDADVVVFLYRAEYYGVKEDEVGDSVADTTDVIFAKHRNGPLKEVTVGSTMKNGRYFDLEDASFTPPVTVPTPAPAAEHFGPRKIALRTSTPSEFSDAGEPVD